MYCNIITLSYAKQHAIWFYEIYKFAVVSRISSNNTEIRNIWKNFNYNWSNVRFYLNKFRGKTSWMHFKRKIRVRQYSSPYKTCEWQWKPGKCNVNLMSVASYYVKYILKWTWIVYTHILFFHELTNVMYFNLTVIALTSLL